MKNDKTARTSQGEKKRGDRSSKKSTVNKSTSTNNADTMAVPTETTKSRVGHGLRNEGTIVPYDGER